MMNKELLIKLGAKPSKSEERGLSYIPGGAISIFSPGISTGGFAEIRMAQVNPERKIIATTIDENGLKFARQVISEIGFDTKIETRFEDVREKGIYPDDFFDFIYARLILHYLSFQDLNSVLAEFKRILKTGGKMFVVVRSEKDLEHEPRTGYNPSTNISTIPYIKNGKFLYDTERYLHTPESISKHLKDAGFKIEKSIEYKEHLYDDFERNVLSSFESNLIEVRAVNE